MLADLAALLDLLKAKGITHIRMEPWSYPPGKELFCGCGVIDVSFAPTLDKAPPDTKPGLDPDVCRCGHGNAEHTNGLCLAGCETEACAPPETT